MRDRVTKHICHNGAHASGPKRRCSNCKSFYNANYRRSSPVYTEYMKLYMQRYRAAKKLESEIVI